MSSFLAVLPVIWEPTAEACITSMLAPDSSLGLTAEEILVVDNSRDAFTRLSPAFDRCQVYRDLAGHNLGVARSWNVAARDVLDRQLDWLVIVSTSMLFGPELHTTFRAEVDAHPDAQIVECIGNSWHLIAIARTTLDTVGLFDEHYWPAYEESIDWGYRQRLLGLEEQGWPRVWCNAMSIGHAVHVDQARWAAPSCPAAPLRAYYEAKWGGPKGAETFTTPFGDPSLPLDWWEPVSIPDLARRYEIPDGEWW